VKDISKQYQHLTADERFRLFVQAMGRKDEQELDRLDNTCPRKTYTQQDWAYTNMKMTFIVYALTSALEAVRTDLLAAIAMGLSLAVDDDDSEKADSIMDAFKKIMQTSLGKKAGWVLFCEGLGVDPEAITAPFLDHVEFVEKFLDAAYEATYDVSEDAASDVAADDAIVAKITAAQVAALEDAWTAKVG
jgi:hypothetical protein